MASTTVSFASRRTPEAALAAFTALAHERGWRPLEQSADHVTVKRPINLKTWGDRIAVRVRPGEGAGSTVQVRVSSWQLVDWGAGRTIAADVEERLA